MCKPEIKAEIVLSLTELIRNKQERKIKKAKDLYNKCLYLFDDYTLEELIELITKQVSHISRIAEINYSLLNNGYTAEEINNFVYYLEEIEFNNYYDQYLTNDIILGQRFIKKEEYNLLDELNKLYSSYPLSKEEYEAAIVFIKRYQKKNGKIKTCTLKYHIWYINHYYSKNLLLK